MHTVRHTAAHTDAAKQEGDEREDSIATPTRIVVQCEQELPAEADEATPAAAAEGGHALSLPIPHPGLFEIYGETEHVCNCDYGPEFAVPLSLCALLTLLP